MTTDRLRIGAWLVAGLAAFGLLSALVPEGRSIGFGLMLASTLAAWTEWPPSSRSGPDRELARLVSVAAIAGLGGLLLALLRPVPTAPLSAAIGLAFAIALLGLLYAGLLPAPSVRGETARTRRQWWYLLLGVSLSAGIVAAGAGSFLWPARVGTMTGRAEVLAATAAPVLAALAASGVVPRSWRRPVAVAATTSLVVLVTAGLSAPMLPRHPELALATMLVTGAAGLVAAAVAFGSGRVPADRTPATLIAGLRIAAVAATLVALLVLAVAIDWTLRHPV